MIDGIEVGTYSTHFRCQKRLPFVLHSWLCLGKIANIHLSSFADSKHLTLCQKAVLSSNTSFNFPHLEALELSDWKMDDSSDGFSWVL